LSTCSTQHTHNHTQQSTHNNQHTTHSSYLLIFSWSGVATGESDMRDTENFIYNLKSSQVARMHPEAVFSSFSGRLCVCVCVCVKFFWVQFRTACDTVRELYL
jgi:hypothetical protein